MKTKTQKKVQRNPLFYESKILFASVLLISSALFTANNANAQFTQGFKLMAGASCQSEIFQLYDNGDLKFAYGAGWIGEYEFNDGLGLQTGIEYLEKGKSWNENEINYSNKFHYLEIPLLAKYTFGDKAGLKKDQFYVAAGPYLSYLLAAKNHENSNTISFTDQANKVDAGLRFGLGFEFPLANSHKFQVGLNYDMGLTEVYKSESGYQNKLATLNVGLIF